MSIDVAVQFATRKPVVPKAGQIRTWVKAALGDRSRAQLTVRIVDEQEGQMLNQQWRGKAHATNVLSFPCSGLEQVAPDLLGDIVVCAPVVAREAKEQCKATDAHWAHMIIHGTLHLLGHDHQEQADAYRMETLETGILADLGYSDPYLTND